MARKRRTPPKNINKLRHAEVELSEGKTVPETCTEIEVTDQAYYRWRHEYGRMRTEQVKHLKELDKKNARLKKLVAALSLDNQLLNEAASGNF